LSGSALRRSSPPSSSSARSVVAGARSTSLAIVSPCGWSHRNGSQSEARIPTASAAAATASVANTVPGSMKHVMPLRTISTQASSALANSSSSSTALNHAL
jgi:hypothetical protein